MTSTAPRSQTESASAATTFSYAQAAKGRMASAAASTAQSSQATSGANTPSKESNIVTETSVAAVNGTEPEIDRSATANGEILGKTPKTGGLDIEIESKNAAPVLVSVPSSPSFGTASTSTLPKADEGAPMSQLAQDSPWERHSAASEAAGEKPADGSERKKKKTKKDRSSEKEPEKEKEDVKPEILVAAAPPAVNIWTQRKEAQAAKVKVVPSTTDGSQSAGIDLSSHGTDLTSTAKQAEPRRKGKVNGNEEAAGQNGTVKEASANTKGTKKGTDGSVRVKDDVNARRSAPRGARANEKDEKSATAQVPPPVGDAISWPTPETALEEEKRKAQEKVDKEEKDDNNPNKPRPKEKWVTVPYIPSVTFNTPLPVRGGRGRGLGGRGGRESGGRGAHASNGSISGEKASVPSGTPSAESRERGRDNASSGRAASLPPNASKRAGGEFALNGRDQRKNTTSTLEKPKADATAGGSKNEASSVQNRRSSQTFQTHAAESGDHDSEIHGADFTKQTGNDQSNGLMAEPFSRSGGPERRTDSSIRAGDFSKDLNGNQSRERGDGRMDRGRGNFRGGRGNHNNFSNGQQHAQQFANSPVPQAQNGYGMRPNGGPYSPPLQQPQYANAFPPPPGGRSGRGGPNRAQSIPNGGPMYGRYPPNGTNGTQMAPIQTSGPVFEYPPTMGSMSAVPFTPYVDQYSVMAMVVMQLEYYFSIDNLCKDVFLRKHMDGQGFVFLSFIASFKRIQSLNQDFELLRFACQESEVIEIVIGEDGLDRIRRRDGWEKWVLASEERDPSARNNGPERFLRQQAPLRTQQMGPRGSQVPTMPVIGVHQNGAPFGIHGAVNGLENGFATPLSAAVPDFSPNPPIINDANYLDAEITFTDVEVENLSVVYRQNSQGDSKPSVPFHGASSRTFSQGSIDGDSLEALQEQEKRSGRTLTNGSSSGTELPSSPDSLRRSRSPFTVGSPTKPLFGNAPPVMWAKDSKVQGQLSESSKEEPYNVICARALRHRESSALGETGHDMRLLYDFWAHFLIRNFNPRMYEEFRRCAFDDANRRQAMFGMASLIAYYNETLNSKKRTIPEIFAKHYVELVKGEDSAGDRPGFAKLRASWRNGALDLKSRKKIDKFVDPQLREELER